MTRSRSSTFLAGATVAMAALAAGCGSGGSDNANASSAATTATTTTTTTSGQSGTVDVASSGLGKILVDSQGHTLYLFEKDSGTKSACTGECATDWPPVRAKGQPTVGDGADASLVGTTQRSDGDPQVTYNGHPLYTYEGDHKAGDTNGQGSTAFGAGWFALSAAGDQVSGQAASSGSGAPSSTNGGY